IKANSDCDVAAKQINTNYFDFSNGEEIESAVNSWYEGINNYDFELGPIKKGENVFEFTKVVWKGAEHIGCATACCKYRGILICKYDNNVNKP
ncbi:cysteine-rich secretory protein, putative, partial [Plasmodium malariae]